MPKNNDIKRVLVIGSGPIIIGQAAEFDYAGTQACRALREEGLEVILINSNPATIMTDKNIADKIYIEPLTVEVIKNVIREEKPDSILPTLGGQTGLNLAMELAESGFLAEMGVKLLGTRPETIKKAEDREAFKETMEEINEPVVPSVIVTDVQAALDFAEEIGYPVIVRPAYTLGGTGGGIAETQEELEEICTTGLKFSRVNQALIEKCISGWKEIEYEVMRDSKGNVITICNMENIDPVGIHTGDSMVVAPSQTLSDKEYQMLRTSALNIISALEIEGGCNVQFALNADSFEYSVIEVNPRVSRSSALASKATGYPIAKISSKIAIGYTLDELKNDITGKTYACFEPTLDYVVVKIPKWPFDKFVRSNRSLGTQMKATGEVMAISNTFEAGFLKALRSLELGIYSLDTHQFDELNDDELIKRLSIKDDRRIFAVCEAIRRGIALEKINSITTMDMFFLNKFKNIIIIEEELKNKKFTDIDKEEMLELKQFGFADKAIAAFTGVEQDDVKEKRIEWGIKAVYKMVDTCAAEFASETPYYYSTYDEENEVEVNEEKKKILVIGSGPIRIGQGIEFDYCSVHAIWELKKKGYETIIINSNPETVSTDFDTADKLYFEPLTEEDVREIIELEKPDGAIVQFGGQTGIKLSKFISRFIPILGSSTDTIDDAEDREKFDAVLEKLEISRPKGCAVFTKAEALEAAKSLGYPVLVRPSYVIGGKGMEIAYQDKDVENYMSIIEEQGNREHPILVDKYLCGKELEVDAICDGTDILIPGIMQHIERAGVHSGDSISVYPTITIEYKIKKKLIEYTEKIAKELNVIGLVNIQFVVYNDEVYIIEVNPRASRTIPYISKVTGIPMIRVAIDVIFGGKLSEMGYGVGLYKESPFYAVKVPVFSFQKLQGVEVGLGPEMKSTGEVLGISRDINEAIYKGLIAAGLKIDTSKKNIVLSVSDNDKQEILPIAEGFFRLGFKIYATSKTAAVLNHNHIPASVLGKISDENNNGRKTMIDMMNNDEVCLIVNTPTKGRQPERDGFKIRRKAVEMGIPCLTVLDTAAALLNCLKRGYNETNLNLHVL